MRNEPVEIPGIHMEVGKIYRLSLTAHSYIKVMEKYAGRLNLIVFNLMDLPSVHSIIARESIVTGYECDLIGANSESGVFTLRTRYATSVAAIE